MDAGRYGPVYRGHDPASGRPIMVRTFTQTLDLIEQARLVEALTQLCATPLDHPSIARPLAAGMERGQPFLVHARLPGMALDEFSAQCGAQPLSAVVVPTITKLAAALDFAAAAGVYHGALGSREIILATHAAGISGLGLQQALITAGVPVDGTTTPTRADDVSALATMAIELLSGRAFTGESLDAALTSLPPADATRLRGALEAALSPDPTVRPATALEFAAALQQAVVEGPGPSVMTEEGDLPLREAERAFVDDVPDSVPALSPSFLVTAAAPLGSSAGSSNGWLVAAGALAVGLLAGFTGGFLVGQRAEPVSPPSSAAESAARKTAAAEPAPTSGQAFTDAPVVGNPDSESVTRDSGSGTRRSEVASALPNANAQASAPPASQEATASSRVQPRDSRTPNPESVIPDPGSRDENTPATLQVLSRPAGADVFVDGALVGRTPLLISPVAPGVHNVRMDLAGYRTWVTAVRVAASDRLRVAASLEQ